MAKNELKAVTAQFNESKKKLDDFKKQNEKAINLNLELSNILCKKIFYLNKKLKIINCYYYSKYI